MKCKFGEIITGTCDLPLEPSHTLVGTPPLLWTWYASDIVAEEGRGTQWVGEVREEGLGKKPRGSKHYSCHTLSMLAFEIDIQLEAPILHFADFMTFISNSIYVLHNNEL